MRLRVQPTAGLMALGLLVAALAGGLGLAAEGPQATTLLVEAEWFQPRRPGWQAIRNGGGNYFVDPAGGFHVSGEQFLHAPARRVSAEADYTVNVPAAGKYAVWVRYEAPLQHSVVFELRLRQNRETVFRGTYGLDPDTVPEKDRPVRYWTATREFRPWLDRLEGPDGLVWERREAELRAGEMRFVLSTAPNPSPAAARNIDCIFLTTDLENSFLEDSGTEHPFLSWMTPKGRVFAKLTNRRVEARCYFRYSYRLNREPWTEAGQFIAAPGVVEGPLEAGDEGWLSPGASTPWVDISSGDTTHPSHWIVTQVSAGENKEINCEVAFAADDKGKRILKRLTLSDANGNSGIVSLPPYPARAPDEIETAAEQTRRVLDHLKKLPAVGKAPLRTLIYGKMLGTWNAKNTAAHRNARRLYKAMGFNTIEGLGPQSTRDWLANMKAVGWKPGQTYEYPARLYPEKPADEARKAIDSAGLTDLFRGIDVGSIAADHWLPKEERDKLFRQWARSNKLPVHRLLSVAPAATKQETEAQWRRLKLRPEPGDARLHPELYVASRRFLARFPLQAAAVRRIAWSPSVSRLTPMTITLPPTVDGRSTAARHTGVIRLRPADVLRTSAALGNRGGVSDQMTGYYVDAARAGPGAGGATIRHAVAAQSPAVPETSLRLNVYQALAHGAKQLDFGSLGPAWAGSTEYVDSRDPSRFALIRQLIHEIGAVDDYLADGSLREPQVAILLSETTDIWEPTSPTKSQPPHAEQTRTSNAYAQERQLLWLALRHAQVDVRFMTEAQVAAGGLEGLKALYLVGDHLRRDAADRIASWVAKGGFLFATAGAGLLDEYDNLNSRLRSVYGIGRQSQVRRDLFFRPQIELPRLRPLDRVRVRLNNSGAFQMEALGIRQRMEARPGAQVIATYADGRPAAVRHRYLEGEAILVGTLPGVAYARSALSPTPPDRGPSAHRLPTRFDASVRTWIASPLRGRVHPDVLASEPLLDTHVITSEHGLLLPIANFRGVARQTVRFVVFQPGRVKRVVSQRFGELPFQRYTPQDEKYSSDLLGGFASGLYVTPGKTGEKLDVLIFSLPVELTDFVTLERP